ncbi:DUF6463 family protein [Nocardiopsis protaetiae]|uniref:DUF6463 family protein n=1 Tax=Nocardiopsis protaetiae TaxID=3382270 RepID=UPI00387AFEF1
MTERNAGRAMLRWASGIMITLGAGHLALLTVFLWSDVSAWAERGLWAAVPLQLDNTGLTVAELSNEVTFWAGPGSFSVPLVVLGALVWNLAGRGVAVPAWVGWVLAAWCLVSGILLVPSPYFVGVVAGLLVVLAARRGRARTAEGGTRPTVSA